MVGVLSIQYNPKIGDKEENFKRVNEIIKQNSDRKVDLVVLPEFFSTGIIDHDIYLDYSESEENGGAFFDWAKEITKKYNTNLVAGSVIEKSGKRLYNTSFVFNRNGEIVGKYRKIHLFNYVFGTEGEVITPGDKAVVLDLDFGKIGINICYDIRYPMHIKNLAKMGAEIVVCPYAWCVEKWKYNNKELLKYEEDIFDCLHKIRAYENLVCIVSSNQVGFSSDELYCIGHSGIFEVSESAPDTRITAYAGNEECAIYADIDLDVVRELRKHYPISTID